jgi:glycosyltransferase involved in cell wall biosynthesis
MKKILYIVSTLKKCGPTNQLSYIIKYLNNNNFEATILTLSDEPEDSMINYFRSNLNIKVDSLKLSRIEGIFKSLSKIKKYINENNIDILHTQGIRADSLVKNIDIPRVATLRNYPYYDYPMTYGKIKGIIMAFLHLHNLKKIDFPVVVSESVSNMLLKKNNYKIGFVRNGIDTERFKKLDKYKLRKKLDLPLDKRIFISVGHLTMRKNPSLIIEAFKKSKESNQLLIFLGDGESKDKCIKQIKNNENILLLGNVKNVNEYLSASDYLISASFAEGFPNTVLESFAVNIPAILSGIPPHIELNKLNNKSSIIFNVNNIDSLINILDKIGNYNYLEMQKNCKKIVKKYLDAKLMSHNYQNIYNKLIGVEDEIVCINVNISQRKL